MLIDTLVYSDKWEIKNDTITNKVAPGILFLFGDSDAIKSENIYSELKTIYPNYQIVGASTAGNILGSEINQSPAIATAVHFEKGSFKTSTVDFFADEDVNTIAQRLISALPQENLKHIFILSDGLNINGSELIDSANKLTKQVSITGGMAGDGDRFQETWVVSNEPAKQFRIVAVGFYGNDFVISSGCFGGWSEFGGNRIITKSSGNVLYELDNSPALELYKKYLGKYADDLPLSGMRFPLSIKQNTNSPELIRTLLAINEEENSVTFAGDIPEGYIACLTKPKIDLLIDGAQSAAKAIYKANNNTALGLVVSCAGRKSVMNELVEDELEILEEVLGSNVQLSGFYSYAEFAPFPSDINTCQLHNQTMTITGIYEK